MKINKANNLVVKDLDQKAGIVQFYGSQFGNIDGDLDVMVNGAFKKTIEENRDRLKHLKNHDTRQAPGVIKEIHEDGIGLIVTSQLIDSAVGRDTLAEYAAEQITEHSIGFNILRDDIDEGTGARMIKEVRLWEVSSLNAWGANENTPTVGLKNMMDPVEHMERINTILSRANISDERGKELEKQFEILKQHIKALETMAPDGKSSTPDGNSREDSINLFEKFQTLQNG